MYNLNLTNIHKETIAHKNIKTLKWVKSKYLRLLEINSLNKVVLYHTLFGNLHVTNLDLGKVINLFATAIALDDFYSQFEDKNFAKNIVTYLQNLYYLVPENFDERALTKNDLEQRAERIKVGKLVNAIQLNVSEGCNLKCSYCFADRVDERATLYNLRARNDKNLMTFDTAVNSIESIKKVISSHGGNALVIKFFGREPLLNWKVIKQVLEYFGETKNGFSYYYTITTNGTLFTEEVAHLFSEYKVRIIVSLDGFAESNTLRQTHTGKETFHLVDEGLKLLNRFGISPCVASVLSDENFQLVGNSFLDYLKEHGVKQWEIKLAMQIEGLKKFTPDEYANYLFKLYLYGTKIGIEVTGDWYDPFVALFHTTRFTGDGVVQRLAPNSCSATDHQISIEPSGSIFGCRALDTRLGEISEIESLFKNPIYNNLSMRTYYNVPFCHGCILEGFCQGVCLGHSEKKYKNIYQPDNDYCEIYRRTLDLLLKNHCEKMSDSEVIK